MCIIGHVSMRIGCLERQQFGAKACFDDCTMAKLGYSDDRLGFFEFQNFFKSFISKEPVRSGRHQIYIEIEEAEVEAAQSRHPFVHTVLSHLDALDRDSKEKLRTIHKPTEEEFNALTLGGILFVPENEFELRYPLPEGESVEYLSVLFREKLNEFRLVDTSFGNF